MRPKMRPKQIAHNTRRITRGTTAAAATAMTAEARRWRRQDFRRSHFRCPWGDAQPSVPVGGRGARVSGACFVHPAQYARCTCADPAGRAISRALRLRCGHRNCRWSEIDAEMRKISLESKESASGRVSSEQAKSV